MELPARSEVDPKLTWNLGLIYENEELFEKDVEAAKALCAAIERDYKGKLTAPERMDACVNACAELNILLEKLLNYTQLAVSVDYTDAAAMRRAEALRDTVTDINARVSFVESEILNADTDTVRTAMERATDNRFYFSYLLRKKAHRLSPETEELLTKLSPTLEAPYDIYHMTKLADMNFPSFRVNGEAFPLGYSLFEDDYEYDERTEVRRAAFRAFSDELKRYENTTAAVYNTQVKTEKVLARARGFESVFDSLLFDQYSSRELYDRQLDVIMEKLAPHMRKYAKLLQRVHGWDKVTYADLKVPLDPSYSPAVTLEEAEAYIAEGLSVMGEDYAALVHEAFRNRWVDFVQNKGKETGGFCASLYRANSFILMTWNDRMSDVMTLAHELGHAANFRLTSENRPYFDTNCGRDLTVEAPSTTNELIMAHYLLKQNPDKRFRRWVLSTILATTYYHNFVTHFLEAYYQREVYRIIDAGGSVQAETLNGIMRDTLSRFWGDAVELTEGAELTWMRQPHYYMGLYSYTYSFGLMIGTQAVKRMEREGAAAAADWKKALSCGGDTSPEAFAAYAGADITTEKPLADTIAYIGEIVEELCSLTDALSAEA